MRAFAIDVTEQSGVSGFVLPGHRVDVVRYEADQSVQSGETILQNILVLASGQVFTRADERTLTNRTVTLAVTPEQVDTLVAVRGKGALSLSLRGLNDQQVVARPRPKSPDPDPMEKRWRLEEEKRKAIEKQLEELKAAVAKKLAEPPAPPPAPAAHPLAAALHDHLSGHRPGPPGPDRPGRGRGTPAAAGRGREGRIPGPSGPIRHAGRVAIDVGQRRRAALRPGTSSYRHTSVPEGTTSRKP